MDTLGHLDYVVRYGIHQAAEYSYRKFSDEIDAVLKKSDRRGKRTGNEPGGYKIRTWIPESPPGCTETLPGAWREIITIGADAHEPAHVAYEFEKATEILRECGFSYYAEFHGRKPVFQRIVP